MENIPVDYTATLDFLYNRLPMFSRVGADAFKKDLTNIQALCRALHDPQKQFKSIHIAGTNGKGSVSHTLAAVLQQSGYKTGLYTSPHLKDFRERIRINGEMVSRDFVLRFVQENMALINDIRPSFFEVTVAMAFAWFAENNVDVAVVEVGLGGRLDSTNILLPELSVITNISYDHQQILGNTLEEIAGEKAGIIKPGVPVVIGETHGETERVFLRRAEEYRSPIIFADQQWKVIRTEIGQEDLVIQLQPEKEFKGTDIPATYTLDLAGSYQSKNILTVLTAIYILKKQGWLIHEKDIRLALSSVKKLTGLRGRWEIIGRDPLIIADVAHNVAGIREVMQQIGRISYHNLHVVTGFVKDKALSPILALFPKKAKYYFCQADIPRALPAIELAEMAASYGLDGAPYAKVKAAFEAAGRNAVAEDLILVCGSVFVVAEILP